MVNIKNKKEKEKAIMETKKLINTTNIFHTIHSHLNLDSLDAKLIERGFIE